PKSAADQQADESAYPRWVWPGFQQPLFAGIGPRPTGANMLIAGCGTGLSAVELARQATNARVLAIDHNLASLSYGKRMAQNFGLANLEFAQADIGKCDWLRQQFDFIDLSGVLDHLADPWEGWRNLLSLLRAGGTMQVGIYSEIARRKIAAARALIDGR